MIFLFNVLFQDCKEWGCDKHCGGFNRGICLVYDHVEHVWVVQMFDCLVLQILLYNFYLTKDGQFKFRGLGELCFSSGHPFLIMFISSKGKPGYFLSQLSNHSKSLKKKKKKKKKKNVILI